MDYFERVEQMLITILKTHENKCTSGKNRVSLTITSNCMKVFQEMAEEW